MEHPLSVLIEITEGIFEIWSRTGNIQEMLQFLPKFCHDFHPQNGSKIATFS
jgi:hypothetical protein